MALGWELARRNIRRRPTEAALVILGSMLGTAIIAAAFVVGDSFDRSIRDEARTSLGPIDEVVSVRPPVAELGRTMAVLEDHISHAALPGTDGMLTGRTTGAVLTDVRRGDGRQTDPDTCVLEVEAAAARRFGRRWRTVFDTARPEVAEADDETRTSGQELTLVARSVVCLRRADA